MVPNYQFLLLIFIAVGFIVFSIFLKWKDPFSKSARTGFLWYNILVCGLVFTVSLVPLVMILPQPYLTIVSWIIYDLLLSYVVFIEVPAWFKISKYDDDSLKLLEKIRANLIEMRFASLEITLGKLKGTISQSSVVLKDESVDNILNDFVIVCEQIRNREPSLWELALSEISNQTKTIKERSKHPFPKLIDLLALSGLSILVAQFLKLLG